MIANWASQCFVEVMYWIIASETAQFADLGGGLGKKEREVLLRGGGGLIPQCKLWDDLILVSVLWLILIPYDCENEKVLFAEGLMIANIRSMNRTKLLEFLIFESNYACHICLNGTFRTQLYIYDGAFYENS